jgi:protein gp37
MLQYQSLTERVERLRRIVDLMHALDRAYFGVQVDRILGELEQAKAKEGG